MRRTGGVTGSGAMLLTLACTILVFLISNPAGAQQVADPLAGEPTEIAASSIGPIAVAGCEAATGETVRIIVADEDDATEEEFTDDAATVFRFGQQGITISAEEGDELDFDEGFDEGNGSVVSSEGITCEDDGRQRVADDGARTTDDLEDLSCDELLALFRGESNSGQQYGTGSGSGQQQYGDADVFADAEVRAQVEVCLEREIVAGTGIDEDLPDTGGPSLLALAVLGGVSAAAGLSVIRGGRR